MERTKVEESNGAMDKGQYIKLLTRTMYDLQELRKSANSRIGAFKRKGGEANITMAEELRTLVADTLVSLEVTMSSRLSEAISDISIMPWLAQLHGIGPRYTGSLVAIIMDIERFRTISALWSYFGMHLIPVCSECDKIAYYGSARLRFCTKQATRRWHMHSSSKKYQESLKLGKAEDEETYTSKWTSKTDDILCQHEPGAFEVLMVAPRRKYFKGLLLDHNPFAKDTAWKISGQYVLQGEFYRSYYELQKARYVERDKGTISDGQLDLRARRAMIKLFLSHLWEMWRKAEGLPAGKSWLMSQRGMDFKTHKYIPPPYANTFDDVKPVEEAEEKGSSERR